MANYEFVCAGCEKIGLILEEYQPPGYVLICCPIAERDTEQHCPNCTELMVRRVKPNFSTWWIDGKSAKRYPVREGPTQNTYLRGDERKKKKQREDSRKHFDLTTPAKERELKADAQRAPKASEAPPSGVSVQKVP